MFYETMFKLLNIVINYWEGRSDGGKEGKGERETEREKSIYLMVHFLNEQKDRNWPRVKAGSGQDPT